MKKESIRQLAEMCGNLQALSHNGNTTAFNNYKLIAEDLQEVLDRELEEEVIYVSDSSSFYVEGIDKDSE
jgi:hypothetical protein